MSWRRADHTQQYHSTSHSSSALQYTPAVYNWVEECSRGQRTAHRTEESNYPAPLSGVAAGVGTVDCQWRSRDAQQWFWRVDGVSCCSC